MVSPPVLWPRVPAVVKVLCKYDQYIACVVRMNNHKPALTRNSCQAPPPANHHPQTLIASSGTHCKIEPQDVSVHTYAPTIQSSPDATLAGACVACSRHHRCESSAVKFSTLLRYCVAPDAAAKLARGSHPTVGLDSLKLVWSPSALLTIDRAAVAPCATVVCMHTRTHGMLASCDIYDYMEKTTEPWDRQRQHTT